MNYISLTFFVFLAVLIAVYAMTPNRYKWMTLLLFSLIFYGSHGADKLLYLLGTSVVVWSCSRRMEAIWKKFDKECEGGELSKTEKKQLRKDYSKKSRSVLGLALFLCLGILCWCKYGARTLSLFNRITGSSLKANIIVPLGVSYYTFSSVGYLLDVHWRKVRTPEKNYFRFLTGMSYFPHIVQGPISRYEKLFLQFQNLTSPDYERLCQGLQLMLWGLFQKMVIADRAAIFVNNVFGNIAENRGFTFIIALIFGAFQMYADFSGCMDLVMGISEIMGIELERNFNHPFFSRTAAEFWRRWHITLGNWFKDYVYVPITTSSMTRSLRKKAGKRFGDMGSKTVMTVIPLGTVWLLTGIWHGTGKNYIVWGLYWGLLIIGSTLFDKLRIETESRTWKYFQMTRTFFLYTGGLLAIVPGSLRNSLQVFLQILSSFNLWIFWDGSLYQYGLDRRDFGVVILSILLLLFVDSLQERMNVRRAIARKPIILRWMIYFAGIFFVLILGVYGPGYHASEFIYGQF